MRGREAKVKTMTREEVSATPRRRPPEVARAEARKRKQRECGERGGGLEGEREKNGKEGDDDVFIFNLGKLTINYPKVYS